jgi:predicted enzyme related to lactoylglutathione lyase
MRISIVIDCLNPDQLRPFWEAALDYELAATLDGYRVLAPRAAGDQPVLILQQVPEPRVGKNRLHLDLHPDDSSALINKLVKLGASLVGERVFLEDISWQVLGDPEGNEFCVVVHGAAVRPR